MLIDLVVMTCDGREASLRETLMSLCASDWGEGPTVFRDRNRLADPRRSQTLTAWQALADALSRPWDRLLFCEDDVSFNRWLRHNLERWPAAPVASLYGDAPDGRLPCDVIGGSQAVLIAQEHLPVVLAAWDDFAPEVMQDLRIYRAAPEAVPFVPVHLPNLVQHRPVASTWGGPAHCSATFDPDWRRS